MAKKKMKKTVEQGENDTRIAGAGGRGEGKIGGVTGDEAAGGAAEDMETARACAALMISLPRRLQREGRWPEVARIRDEMMRECLAKHMPKKDARAWVYAELDRLYPPLLLPKPAVASASEPTGNDNGHLQGIEDLPADWPALPANAAQAAEIGWVQANRLSVIEELPTGATRVDLSRAHEPAPSRAALGWLETSIRSYAKYVDVVARVLRDEQDEQDYKRHERVAIGDIEELLMQMQEA